MSRQPLFEHVDLLLEIANLLLEIGDVEEESLFRQVLLPDDRADEIP